MASLTRENRGEQGKTNQIITQNIESKAVNKSWDLESSTADAGIAKDAEGEEGRGGNNHEKEPLDKMSNSEELYAFLETKKEQWTLRLKRDGCPGMHMSVFKLPGEVFQALLILLSSSGG